MFQIFQNISSNIYDLIVEPQLNEFVSSSFEEICIEWLREKNRKKELPFIFTQIGRWWSKDVEIDIVATNEDKSEFLSAECKFHNSVINDSDLQKHLNKNLTNLQKKENALVHIWYFSLKGYTAKARTFAAQNEIVLIEGKDLF